jgi:hypothetical protein
MDGDRDQGPQEGGTDRRDRDPVPWWAWGGLGWPRSAREVRPWHVLAPLLVGLTIFGRVGVAPNGRIDRAHIERHKTDFTVYTEAGAAFFDGRDPYRVTNPRRWYYLYPPLFALMVAPLSALDGESQVLAWYVISVAIGFGCFVEARRIWRGLAAASPARAPSRWIVACAFLAVLLPTLDCLQRGQMGLALLYPLLLGYRLAEQGRSARSWFIGGVIIALPAAVKLVPLLPVGFLLLQLAAGAIGPRRGRRSTIRATAVTAGVLVGGLLYILAIPSACIGWRKNLDHLHTWVVRVAMNDKVGRAAKFDIHALRNQSMPNAVHLLFRSLKGEPTWDWSANIQRECADPAAARVVLVLRGAMLASLLALGLFSGLRGDGLARTTAFGLACCATLPLSPLTWGHYYMIELLALLGAPLWLSRRGWLRTSRVVSAVPPLLIWPQYLVIDTVGPIGLLGLGTTVWFLAVCALMAAPSSRSGAAAGPRSPAFGTPHRMAGAATVENVS